MTYFRYVGHGEIEHYLAKGWIIDDDMQSAHHDRHAVLMRWTGPGEPE